MTAELDFHALWTGEDDGRDGQLAAAVVEKGGNGWLEMTRHHSTVLPAGFGAVLLGSVLTVLAAPLGITHLTAALATRGEWKGAAAIVGHFWHEVPRDLLRTMSNLAEAGQTGLVVVATDRRAEQVTPVLTNATNRIVTDCVRADFAVDFARASQGAPPASPISSPAVEDAGGATRLL
jgi:hypothetical protein